MGLFLPAIDLGSDGEGQRSSKEELHLLKGAGHDYTWKTLPPHSISQGKDS